MYRLLRFERQPEQVNGHTVFVALVQKEGEEQPFRVVVENFETVEEARAQVARWIAEQEGQDARALAEVENEKKKAQEDELLAKLNEGL